MANDEMLKVTLDQLEALGLGDLEEILEYGLKERAKIKRLEDEVKDKKQKVNDIVLPVMIASNIGSVSSKLGVLVYQHTIRQTLVKEQLVNAMLGKGWDANDIADVIKQGSKESVSDSVAYRKPNGK